MTTSHSEPEGRQGSPVRAWPRLGDLAADSSRGGEVGLIVGVPGEDGANWRSYQLEPPGGGQGWSAPPDASTLLPVPSPVTHVSLGNGPFQRQPGRHWALPVRVHYQDGSKQGCSLIIPESGARLLAGIGEGMAGEEGRAGHTGASPGDPRPPAGSPGELARVTSRFPAGDPVTLRDAPDFAGARILVTGAAGFLGSHLCERLVGAGAHVVGVDNLSTGRMGNLAALDGHPAFEFRRRDVTVPCRVLGDLDVIIHLASPAAPGDYLGRPLDTLRAGSVGTLNLAEAAQAKGALLVLASTSEVYGDPLEHPQRESYCGNVNPVGPRSVYDEAKRFAEAVTAAYARLGARTAIARIFNTYGPRMSAADSRVVPTFLRQACAGQPLTVAGDGSQTRSLCYVEDTVDALARLAGSGCAGPVNIGGTHEISVLQLAGLISELCESPAPVEFVALPDDDPKRRRPDITRAARELGWQPRVSLADGLARTLAWYRHQRGVKAGASA
jgi:dTDP-glucose 4,6-dehydratase